MSYKSPSKPAKLKLPLPASQDPSFHEADMKYNNSLPISPIRAKEATYTSPIKNKMQLQTTMTTAATKSHAQSPSPQKVLTGQNFGSAQRHGLLSRATTIPVDKSVSAEKEKKVEKARSQSPSNKQRRGSFLQELGMTTTEVKERLYKVFQFYTSFGERSNVAYLKAHRFTKMMIDAEVRDEYLNQSSLDLLFVGELKHSGNLDFDKFLSLLTRVARAKYEDKESEAESLEALLKENMFPLYERIFKDIGMAEETFKVHEPVEESTKMVLNVVGSVLERIYNMYFPFEIQTGQDPQVLRQRLENALFIFLREFGICPALINKGSAYAIWNDVLKADLGAVDAMEDVEQAKKGKAKGNEKGRELPFSFERFKLFLIKISNLAYGDQMVETESGAGVGIGNATGTGAGNATGIGAGNGTGAGFGAAAGAGNGTGIGSGATRVMAQPERAMKLLEKMDMAFKVLNPEKKAAMPSSGNGTVSGKGSGAGSGNGNGNGAVAGLGLGTGIGTNSLLVTKDHLEKINAHIKNQEENGVLRPKKGKGAKNNSPGVIVTSGTKYENYGIVEEDLIRLFEKYNHSLLKIFQYYSSFGEPLNTTKLHAFKFIKLLKEAGLLPATVPMGGSEQFFKILKGVPVSADGTSLRLTVADVDIIVASLTGPKHIREINNSKINYDTNIPTPFIGYLNYLFKNSPLDFAAQGRLEFEAFLKALELVAQKVYPETAIGKAATSIVEKNLLKLEKEIDQIQKMVGSQPLKALVDVLQDVEMVQFLGVVHKSISQYYKCYADTKGMMNIEKFIQFCKDFSVFPGLVAKGKLCTFFHALAGVRSQAEATDVFKNSSEQADKSPIKKSKSPTKAIDQPEDEVIDQHMFVEALVLCALEIPYLNPQPTEKQKIFNFLEKINQSQGMNIVKTRVGSFRSVTGPSWDLLHEIKAKHPEFYMEPKEDEDDEDL